jgi:hypothetical protein
MCGNHQLIGLPTGARRAYAYQKVNPLLLARRARWCSAALRHQEFSHALLSRHSGLQINGLESRG